MQIPSRDPLSVEEQKSVTTSVTAIEQDCSNSNISPQHPPSASTINNSSTIAKVSKAPTTSSNQPMITHSNHNPPQHPSIIKKGIQIGNHNKNVNVMGQVEAFNPVNNGPTEIKIEAVNNYTVVTPSLHSTSQNNPKASFNLDQLEKILMQALKKRYRQKDMALDHVLQADTPTQTEKSPTCYVNLTLVEDKSRERLQKQQEAKEEKTEQKEKAQESYQDTPLATYEALYNAPKPLPLSAIFDPIQKEDATNQPVKNLSIEGVSAVGKPPSVTA